MNIKMSLNKIQMKIILFYDKKMETDCLECWFTFCKSSLYL